MSKQNKPKKAQHYIPQYYLRKFCSKPPVFRKNNKQGKPIYDYYVWFYNKKTKQYREVDTECVEKKDCFYDVPKTQLLSILKVNTELNAKAYLENNLWEKFDYESSITFNEILKKIEEKHGCNEDRYLINNIIDNTDKEKLIKVLISQLFRTPKFRNEIINILNSLIQMSQLWSIGDENSDDLIKKILKIVLENPQYLHADSYLIKSDIREELYCSLKNRAFFIGINTTNKPLLTSDSPVVFDNGVEGFNGIRLSGEGLEISFPISPNYVVIIINTKKYPHLMDDNIKGIFLDVEVVTDLNNLQFLQSVSQVYSKESFKWIYDGA